MYRIINKVINNNYCKSFMKRKAFTLIELLIALSIIWVLFSVSIISFSWYWASARDAKRITDAEEILARVNAEFVKAVDLSELIIEEKQNSLKINWISKKWYQWTTNFIKIKEDSKNFRDPSNNQNYPIAYAQTKIENLSYAFTQIATICETWWVAKLIWNYNKILEWDSPSLFTKTWATWINIPEDYIENNGKVLPYIIEKD